MIATMNGQASGWRAQQDRGATPELPPSERDFLVFEAVMFSGASTRETAAEFEISQTRVMQIRKHVAEWIARSVPDGLELSPIERLRLAVHIAEGRSDHLYDLALGAWRESQKPATSACRGTPRASHGDPRYLLAAARLNQRQLDLAGAVRKVFDDAQSSKFQVPGSKLAESREGEAPAEPPALLGKPAVAPSVTLTNGQGFGENASPDRDCSADERDLVQLDKAAGNAPDATPVAAELCKQIEARRQAFLAALENDTAPVHPPFTDAGGMLLDATEPAKSLVENRDAVIQLQLNGHEPGAALSATAVAEGAMIKRHQRRARQRELDRLRRRAR